MAVSTFTGAGGAAGGTNDFGGTLVGSFTGKGDPFVVDIDLTAGDYLVTVKCPLKATVVLLSLDPLTLSPTKTLVSITAEGENSALVQIDTNVTKVLINGLSGIVVFTRYDSPTSAAEVSAGVSSTQNYFPVLDTLWSRPSYFDGTRSVLENDTHWAVRSQPQAGYGSYSFIEKATKAGSGFTYMATSTSTPWDYSNSAYVCKIGMKNGLVLSDGRAANSTINKVGRFIYDETLREYVCKAYEANGVVNAPWSASANYTSILYMPNIDTFVATSNVDGYLYYSTDDGVTWSQGASITASYYNLTYDAEAQLLLIDEGSNVTRSYFEYIADPTTGTAASWSYPFNGADWYVPIYNSTGGFWTTARYSSNSNTYTSTSTGGGWSTVSAASFPSGYTGIPVVADGKTYVPNGDTRSSGLGMVYSADGTTWTSVNIATNRWYQGYGQSVSQCWYVVENGFIKWFSTQYGGYCWDIANEEAWMSGPTFGPQYYMSSIHPNNKVAFANSSRYCVSVDGHRFYGSSYTTWSGAFQWFNGKLWGQVNNSYYTYSLTPNPDGTWTLAQEPTYSSGYSAAFMVTSGDKYAIAPSSSTSYNSGHTTDGGVTWNGIATFNRVVACADGSFVGWVDSPNYWGHLQTSGAMNIVKYDSGGTLTNWNYSTPQVGIPFRNGALIWYYSGTTLETYFVANSIRETANSINLTSIGLSSSQGTGALWEFAGVLFFDVLNYSPSAGQSRLYQFVSLDGGASWLRNEVEADQYNRFFSVYPQHATQINAQNSASIYEGYGHWPVTLYADISATALYANQIGNHFHYKNCPRHLTGKVSLA